MSAGGKFVEGNIVTSKYMYKQKGEGVEKGKRK